MSGIGPINRVTPQRGELLYSAITASTAGTANTVMTLASDSRLLTLHNTTDVEIMVTQGGHDFKRLPTGLGFAFDFGADGSGLADGTVIGAYRTGSSGSSGYIEALSFPTRTP